MVDVNNKYYLVSRKITGDRNVPYGKVTWYLYNKYFAFVNTSTN